MVAILMMSAKLIILDRFKIKLFYCHVITFVHGVTCKILLRESNNIADVDM